MTFDFQFGRYALFVWAAYGLSAAVSVMVVQSPSLSRGWSRKARQAHGRLHGQAWRGPPAPRDPG